MTDELSRTLLRLLRRHFDEEGLRTLCFCLDVDYDDLPAEGKTNKARELVKYLESRGRIYELVETGRQERPDVPWPAIPQPQPEAQPEPGPGPEPRPELQPRRKTRPQVSIPQWGWALTGLVVLAVLVVTVVALWRSRPSTPDVIIVYNQRDGELVDYAQALDGSYRGLEAGWHLWGLVQDGSGAYWIQGRLDAEPPRGEWRLMARFGEAGTRSVGETYRFLFLAVEEGSDAERYLRSRSAQGFLEELPTGRARVLQPGITLTRGNPSDRWLADFWGNDAWEGEPVATQEITSTYLFQEWEEPPGEGLPETGWTARFVRRVSWPEEGEYCFFRVRDDEANVWIDGEELEIPRDRQDWKEAETACRELEAGEHSIRVDYANLTDARGCVEFWYDGPGVQPPTGVVSGTWQATFFPTTSLTGKPVWSTALPGPFLDVDMSSDDIPVVNFGAIFTRPLTLTQTGTYRFELVVDDGGRFYIDDEQVLEEWHGGPARYTVEKHLEAGEHRLRLDYLEYLWQQYATLKWGRVADPITPVQRILFVSDRAGNDEIYGMDANGANPGRLTHNGYPDRDPAWSPDGRRIVFASDPEGDGTLELYVMEADGEGVSALGVAGYQPRWSPDGSRIAFVSEAGGSPKIYVMDADGRNVRQLTAAGDGTTDCAPDWSPDGSRIVFESGPEGGDNAGDREIYGMDAEGGDRVNLTNNPAWDGAPAWSPDGRSIAFFSNRDGNDEIFLMEADGGNQRRLTLDGTAGKYPAWSPDGRFLVYEGYDAESVGPRLYRIEARGTGSAVRLTEHWGRHERPRWSPPAYGFTFESVANGDAVNQRAMAVAGDYVWTGGSGGVVRWNRDDPQQQQAFRSEDGLAENEVTAVLAEGESVLWLGTGGWPFDGSGLSRYESDAGREHWRTLVSGDGLGVDTVFGLYRDGQGRIWAGTKGAGLRVYDGRQWRGFEETRSDWAYAIFEDSDSIFWFGLLGTGILRYDPGATDGTGWQRFDVAELLASDNAGYNFATAIIEGAAGELWIGTNAGVVRHYEETWAPAGGALDVWTSAAVRDVDGALWFATTAGLVRLTDGEQRSYTGADGLTGIVRALFLDDAGTLWAAGNGLNRYDREQERWQSYHTQDGPAANYVSAILQDERGAVWLGHSILHPEYTWGAGASRYMPGSAQEWRGFDTEDGLSQNGVHVIYQEQDGPLWFGFDREGGGVCRYDVRRGRWLPCYRADPTGLAADEVDSIVQTGDGALWFGTSGGGLSRFDHESWETFTQANSDLSSNQVHCLAEDGEGGLWITTDKGVNRFSYEKDEWVTFNKRNSDLIADEVLAVSADGSGGMWLGTKDGLSHYDIAKKKWQSFPGTPALPAWVSNCTQALHVDRQGTVWVGTDEGLYRSTAEEGWLRLTTASGLASNHVLAIFEDGDGTLWIGTPSGVSRLTMGE